MTEAPKRPPTDALSEFDRFCRFIDGLNMNGFVENDFMSKPIQEKIRSALKAQQKPQVSVYGGATGCPTPEPEVVTVDDVVDKIYPEGVVGICGVNDIVKRVFKYYRVSHKDGGE